MTLNNVILIEFLLICDSISNNPFLGLKDAFKIFLFPETHVYQAESKKIKVKRQIQC